MAKIAIKPSAPAPVAKKPETCGNCFYRRADRCMRFPPQVVNTSPYPSNSGQPYVNVVGWCGEYRATE